MKRLSLLLIGFLLSVPYIGQTVSAAPEFKIEIPDEVFHLDVLTIYNPTFAQCDKDPLITASLAEIDLSILRKQEIKWIAVSRDMLTRWGGKLNYGDTVQLIAGDKNIDGQWIVQDTMNKRYQKRGDLLFHSDIRTAGLWTDVKLIRKNPPN